MELLGARPRADFEPDLFGGVDGDAMKTIDLWFRIPAEVDTPSETLLHMRDLLLDALQNSKKPYNDEDRVLVDALLTES